jgi:methionyl-tRNA formyltransferase
MTRIIFMGTPEFAVPGLCVLDGGFQVVAVVTQPDRPAGRGRKLTASPVKERALALGLPVLQPPTLRDPAAVQELADLKPDLIVVASFGQILKAPVLDLPPHGCLNLHASLLPRYRGATPIPAAILAGDEVTGITLMRMDEGLDTGPIIAQAQCLIDSRDTTASLTARLADLAADLLDETLPGWLAGTIPARPQDDSSATYCHPLRKEDGRLDWHRPVGYLDRQVRACDPWPGTFSTWQGRRLKVLSARPHPAWPGGGEPGLVVDLDPGVGVVAGQGALELLEVQLAGKKPMAVDRFILGQQDLIGSSLGS